MATGVPDVDDQHQEWIARFNKFDDAVSNGRGLEEIQSTLDFFADYAETHFHLEEARMAERDCPAAEENRIDHNQIRSIIAGYRQYVKRNGASVIEVMGLRLRMQEWLVNHILTIDIRLRGC
jgi:hemerythrin-like metal-binding protein